MWARRRWREEELLGEEGKCNCWREHLEKEPFFNGGLDMSAKLSYLHTALNRMYFMLVEIVLNRQMTPCTLLVPHFLGDYISSACANLVRP